MDYATIPPIKINSKSYEHLKILAKKDGKNVSSLIRSFIDAYLEKRIQSKTKAQAKKEVKKLIDTYGFSLKGVKAIDYKQYLEEDMLKGISV